jgi:hypothetical protein
VKAEVVVRFERRVYVCAWPSKSIWDIKKYSI